MIVLPLLEERNLLNKIPYVLGKKIGAGGDGSIYDISNNKVIKLSIIYDMIIDDPLDAQYKQSVKVFSYLKDNNPKGFAKVYDFGFLCKDDRQVHNYGKDDFIIHFHVMEKLNKLSEKDKSILFHILNGFEKKLNSKIVIKELIEIQKYIDFDLEKVKMFYNQLLNSKITHCDLHVRNIMKNNDDEFLLIDFDRCKLKL